MKTILITGGLGYVGGRITESLLSLGNYKIIVTSRKGLINNKLNGNGLLKVVNFSDVLNGELKERFDAIIHLAAFNEIDCAANPVAAAEFNIIETLKLLQFAVKNGCLKFIYFSTVHVYGSPLFGNYDESSLTKPIHPYAITHKSAEDFILAAREKKEIDSYVIRLSNAFGRPADVNVNRWTLLLNDLCKQAILSKKLKLLGNGKQNRDFISLTNVVNCVCFLLENELGHTDGLFNLCSKKTSTVYNMASLIQERTKKLFNKHVEVVINENDTTETNTLNISNNKLSLYGFNVVDNDIEELDDLLIFCNQNFS